MPSRFLAALCVSFVATWWWAAPARAVILGPYTADTNTLHLWHFDETAGTGSGNPFVDFGNGTTYNLTNTGGPNGRDGAGPATGGYGGGAFGGFGSSFNVLQSGNGAAGSSAMGGGAFGANAASSMFQNATTGAFTWEALIKTNNTSGVQTIISRDHSSSTAPNRSGMFRINNGNLSLFSGVAGNSAETLIPTTGAHAFVADQWYHVAVTFTGMPNVTNNVEFFWTRLDPMFEEANSLGTTTLTQWLNNTGLGVPTYIGNATSDGTTFSSQMLGFIDEVRISGGVRGAGGFLFAPATVVPEPSSLALFSVLGALAAVYAVGSRRNRRSPTAQK